MEVITEQPVPVPGVPAAKRYSAKLHAQFRGLHPWQVLQQVSPEERVWLIEWYTAHACSSLTIECITDVHRKAITRLLEDDYLFGGENAEGYL